MKIYIQDMFNEQGEAKGKLYIESDSMQFIVKEETKSKDGRDYSINHDFFSHLSQAAQFVVKMNIMQSTAKDLQELLRELRTIKSDIEAKIAI